VTEPPLIVQTDRTVLLETQHPGYEAARDRLARFAELEKSPEYVHFYKITPVSIWNAAALGETADDVRRWLVGNARFPIVPTVLRRSASGSAATACCGCCRGPAIGCGSNRRRRGGAGRTGRVAGARGAAAGRTARRVLAAGGAPRRPQAGAREARLPGRRPGRLPRRRHAGVRAARDAVGGRAFTLRDYQQGAAAAFHAGGSDRGGCGVVVLPCGAGKTVVGIAAMHLLQTNTLVLTTNTVAVRQWCRESPRQDRRSAKRRSASTPASRSRSGRSRWRPTRSSRTARASSTRSRTSTCSTAAASA
jgi:DNA excision repair protein ERCC-3